MCLDIVETVARRIKKSLRGGRVRFWKVFDKKYWYSHSDSNARLLSNPYSQKENPTRISQRGFIKSDRKSKKLTKTDKYYKEVHKGIHVFVNKEDAERHVSRNYAGSNYYCILPVYADKRDFVAAGYGLTYESAVFTKVRIKKEDLKENNIKNIEYYYGKTNHVS